MPRKTINVLMCNPGEIVKASGTVAILKVGNTKVRFILQTELKGRECGVCLVHEASGRIAINARRLSNFREWRKGLGYKRTAREGAKVGLQDIVNRLGEKHVMNIMTREPELNFKI